MARKSTRTRAGAAAPKKGPSQRQLRVGELMRHKLAEMLTRGDIHDEVLASHVITISEVRMSPDMGTATIYVMPLGGTDVKPVLDAFKQHDRYIRGELARTVNLRHAPQVRFREDVSFEEATRIDRLLDSPKVRQDTAKRDVGPDTTNSDAPKD